MASSDQAFVTLATNDTYSLGALVLAHSLRNVATTRKLAVLITPGVTNAMRSQLSSVFDLVQEVNVVDSRDDANLALLTRPELGVTFTKLHCWRLTQFSKCVFMDADTLVLQNCDELFEREELSAVPDCGWPDCFNSGVFVYRPSNETYLSLIKFAVEHGSFDGGDQGLLNLYFNDWATKDISKHLSFIYNMNATSNYQYAPAYKQFGKNTKIVHFIGSIKPWAQEYSLSTGQVKPRTGSEHSSDHLQPWWDIFMEKVQPYLQKECDIPLHPNVHKVIQQQADLAGRLADLSLYPGAGAALSSQERQYAWERGHVDYLGADAFENIQKRLDEAIKGKEEESKETTTTKSTSTTSK